MYIKNITYNNAFGIAKVKVCYDSQEKRERMEIETLKRSHLKRNIIITVVVVAIISAIILTFTRAKFKNTESIPLVNGTINYSLADLNIVAIKVDGREVDTLPDGNYELTSESYCTINNEKDNNIKLSYDSESKTLTVTPMTKKGTKCYLYFDIQLCQGEACNTILANSKVNEGKPNFASVATTDEGVYKTEDDWGESYYFRGAVGNNWVRFAGYYWRIIRINGDGSIRLIYNGTSTATTGESTMINSSQAFNSSYDRSEYVGYMYTTGQQHGNTRNSPIKTVIDSWYSSNLASYSDKISTEAGFCGDREMRTGYSWSSSSSRTLYYKAYERLYINKTPTLKCSNSADLYTVSESSKGNKALSNPVGLITADEVSMAGGVFGQNNTSYYLYNDTYYWTMSPYSADSDSWASVFSVNSSDRLGDGDVRLLRGVRPVINLANNVTISSGNGSVSNPYVISSDVVSKPGFTVENYGTFEFEGGMTWTEWVSSSYGKNSGFDASDGSVVFTLDYLAVGYNGKYVMGEDTIVNGRTYISLSW